MTQQIMLVVGDVGVEAAAQCHELAQTLADRVGLPVAYSRAEPADWLAHLATLDVHARVVPVTPAPAGAMSSADFLYRPDGRPDWGAMWQSFCELALFSGPPHRGDDSTLRHHPDDAATGNAVEEVIRGIAETTGLSARPAAEPGWLEVTCSSPKMAAWMCACIVLENVDARFAEDSLFVPADSQFSLKDEVKSVITVVAKLHHYWVEHTRKAATVERRAR